MNGTSWASSPGVSRSMRANRRRDTLPELAVRHALHARGFRYRVDYGPLQGIRTRADIVFTKARVAVFIDGCFWHGCPTHGTSPSTNASYWLPKLRRNVERDAAANLAFEAAGWVVIRVWEHESPVAAAEKIAGVVRAKRGR